MTQRSRAGSPSAARTTSRQLHVRAYEKVARALLRREPASARAPTTRRSARARHLLSWSRQHHGKQLSFNNLLDLDAARRLCDEFERAGVRDRQAQQPLRRGARGDRDRGLPPRPRMRPAVGLRRRRSCSTARVDRELAEALNEQFIEVLFAPGYDEDALEILRRRRTCACSRSGDRRAGWRELEVRQVAGGVLVQDRDTLIDAREDMRSSPRGVRARRNGRTCCSPGGSASTCVPTRSCSPATAPRSASAPAR